MMSPQKYTDAKRDSNRKWDAANLDRVSVAMPKGKRDLIRAAAVAAGESMNQYINGAIDARMDRDRDLAIAAKIADEHGVNIDDVLHDEEFARVLDRHPDIKAWVLNRSANGTGIPAGADAARLGPGNAKE